MSSVINLLPPDLKESYRYGRHNRALAHWISTAVLCLAGAALLTGGGYVYLTKVTNDTNKQIADTSRQLRAQNQAQVQKQVTTISNNLKLATQVLSNEILFSQLLKQLGTVLPKNAVLTSLDISQTKGGLDITAATTDYATATQLQVNLADPANKIFDKADIVSISCGSSSNAQYPCSVTVRALFAKNNPFLFINNKAGSKT